MPKEKTRPTEYFLAGGTAGVLSRTCIAPIERVKILYQINKGAGSSGAAVASTIFRNEGMLAFWKGNTAAVARVMPYMSLTFLTFEEYKVALNECEIMPKEAATMAAGSAAGVTAVVLTYPLDLVRATMATSGGAHHSSMFSALVTIARERGVGALYSGVTATCIGVAPYAGLKFLSYEALKGVMGRVSGLREEDLRADQRLGAGLVAGMVAQTFVYPLDVVRRRMQTSTTAMYTSTWDALSTIARQEGVKNGLYRGLSLNYLKTMPNVAIYMTVYDICKKWLRESGTLS